MKIEKVQAGLYPHEVQGVLDSLLNLGCKYLTVEFVEEAQADPYGWKVTAILEGEELRS